MTPTSLPKFRLVAEAAADARCSPWLIRKEIKAGRLKARVIGRCVRILEDDLAAWMTDHDLDHGVTSAEDQLEEFDPETVGLDAETRAEYRQLAEEGAVLADLRAAFGRDRDAGGAA
jgi:hypothetical protein